MHDLGRRFEVAEGVFAHLPRLNAPALHLNAVCPENPAMTLRLILFGDTRRRGTRTNKAIRYRFAILFNP